MSKKRRQFSPEEKYSILQESEREGLVITCRKYQLAHSVVRYWKQKYLSNGKEGLKAGHRKTDPNVRLLEEENARLKRIIANQALELEVKDELLKKGEAHFQRGKRSL
jgi:transposase-like protein